MVLMLEEEEPIPRHQEFQDAEGAHSLEPQKAHPTSEFIIVS